MILSRAFHQDGSLVHDWAPAPKNPKIVVTIAIALAFANALQKDEDMVVVLSWRSPDGVVEYKEVADDDTGYLHRLENTHGRDRA